MNVKELWNTNKHQNIFKNNFPSHVYQEDDASVPCPRHVNHQDRKRCFVAFTKTVIYRCIKMPVGQNLTGMELRRCGTPVKADKWPFMFNHPKTNPPFVTTVWGSIAGTQEDAVSTWWISSIPATARLRHWDHCHIWCVCVCLVRVGRWSFIPASSCFCWYSVDFIPHPWMAPHHLWDSHRSYPSFWGKSQCGWRLTCACTEKQLETLFLGQTDGCLMQTRWTCECWQ